MIGEIIALVIVFVGLTIFAVIAWRLTLHVIGVDSHELALWKARFLERRAPEAEAVTSGHVPAVPANSSDAADRVERILLLLDEKPAGS
jgi:hypothetical protein